MKIVLLERITKLGQMGDIVEVKSGFARNFLLPNGKALRATNQNIQFFECFMKMAQSISHIASDTDTHFWHFSSLFG